MLFSSKQSLEDIIISILGKGPSKTTILIHDIKKIRTNTTKQGIYRVLRILAQQETIVLHKKTVSLNIKWLNEINSFSTLAQYHYFKNKSKSGSFVNLQEGEKIKYIFNSLSLADAFWNHAIYILLQIIPKQELIVGYHPHDWFWLARPEQERILIKTIIRNRQYLLTVGDKTAMDKIVSNEFDGIKSQYCMLKKTEFKNNYYINILGDYLIEVHFDLEIAEDIAGWYKKTKKLNHKNIQELQNIIKTKKKNKLVISRNLKKANRLRTKLQKNFYIKKTP